MIYLKKRFQNCRRRRKESLKSVKNEPRYPGSYQVLKEVLKPMDFALARRVARDSAALQSRGPIVQPKAGSEKQKPLMNTNEHQ